jgi:hypothetical protein
MVSNLSWQTYRCCRQPERIRRTLSTCLNNNYINPIATNWWLRIKAWKLKFNFFHIYCITIVTQHLNRSLSNTVLFSEKKKQLLLCKKWDCKYTNLISHLKKQNTPKKHDISSVYYMRGSHSFQKSIKKQSKSKQNIAVLLRVTHILRRNLEPTRWGSLVWQSRRWNTLTAKKKKIKWILELSFKVVIMTLFKGISRGIETHPLLCIRPMVTDFGDLLLLLQSL